MSFYSCFFGCDGGDGGTQSAIVIEYRIIDSNKKGRKLKQIETTKLIQYSNRTDNRYIKTMYSKQQQNELNKTY